jgi:hypothetical protein
MKVPGGYPTELVAEVIKRLKIIQTVINCAAAVLCIVLLIANFDRNREADRKLMRECYASNERIANTPGMEHISLNYCR